MASFLGALADGRVGVAEHAGFSVAGEESEDAVLAAGAFGDIVFFDQRLVAVIGDRVEVEVEGGAGDEAVGADGAVPIVHQRGDPAGVDAGGVLGEGGALGHGVEAREEGEAGIEDLGHGL